MWRSMKDLILLIPRKFPRKADGVGFFFSPNLDKTEQTTFADVTQNMAISLKPTLSASVVLKGIGNIVSDGRKRC